MTPRNRDAIRGEAVILLAGFMLTVALIAGCYQEAQDWPDPVGGMPDWAFDAPYYYQPQPGTEVKAADPGFDGLIPHYYARQTAVMVKRPDNSDSASTPRLAVFYTQDHGGTWAKAGYFGINQNYFAFVAPGQGDFGLRFAGPGFAPTRFNDVVPPHRVYHVDTTPPQVVVRVDPTLTIYEAGQEVTVSWYVIDSSLDPQQKALLYAINRPGRIKVAATDLPLAGEHTLVLPEIPPEGGLQFAVEAVDRAGNIGRGFTIVLRSVDVEPSATQPDIIDLERNLFFKPGQSADASESGPTAPPPLVFPQRSATQPDPSADAGSELDLVPSVSNAPWLD